MKCTTRFDFFTASSLISTLPEHRSQLQFRNPSILESRRYTKLFLPTCRSKTSTFRRDRGAAHGRKHPSAFAHGAHNRDQADDQRCCLLKSIRALPVARDMNKSYGFDGAADMNNYVYADQGHGFCSWTLFRRSGKVEKF